jgi:hypothetical protein
MPEKPDPPALKEVPVIVARLARLARRDSLARRVQRVIRGLRDLTETQGQLVIEATREIPDPQVRQAILDLAATRDRLDRQATRVIEETRALLARLGQLEFEEILARPDPTGPRGILDLKVLRETRDLLEIEAKQVLQAPEEIPEIQAALGRLEALGLVATLAKQDPRVRVVPRGLRGQPETTASRGIPDPRVRRAKPETPAPQASPVRSVRVRLGRLVRRVLRGAPLGTLVRRAIRDLKATRALLARRG